MIENLSLRINQLQHQLEALAQKDHCHTQDSSLQAAVNDLTGKKLELEVKLKEMSEKATSAIAELQ